MKRLSLILMALLLAVTQHVHAQYYSVNYDTRTVAAMAVAFGTEAVAESYYREQVDDILKHYTAAEVAATAPHGHGCCGASSGDSVPAP